MKYLLLVCLLPILVGCKEKHYGYAKAKIVDVKYKTIGRGYYRTKFICTFKYHKKEEVGFALGQTHFCAVAECSIGDSVLIKFEKDKIQEAVVVDIFYRERNIYGDSVDNTLYRGKYNQLE